MEDVRIVGNGSELQGVGRLMDGRVVFVPNALCGELVRIEVIRETPRYCEGRLVEVLESAPARRTPDCPAYGHCGGCQGRHMSYAETLTLKRQRVFDVLERIGGLQNPCVFETIGCEFPDRCRNKAEYPIGKDATGRICIGAYAAGSHEIVPLKDCLLQKEASVRALAWFSEHLHELRCAGQLAALVTRVNRAGRMMLILCAKAPVMPEIRSILPKLTASLPELDSVYFLLQNRRPAHALDGQCTHLWGAKTLDEQLFDLTFSVSPQSFFQVNPVQTEILYQKALEAAGLSENCNARVLDAYCGAGTISLAAARQAAHVTGVEIVAPAVADARANARRNHLAAKTTFICGDAPREIAKLIQDGCAFDAAILDPPRKGVDEKLLQALLVASPARIAYVSCNPATLARDVKFLVGAGYHLEWAQPVDMFPWTGHVETVVLLSKGEIDSKKVRVEFSLEDMDMSGFQKGATYEQIKAYVLEHTGLKVSSLYISQIKCKCGLDVGQNYNLSKKEDAKVPQCPPEKEAAIMEALKYFQMI